MIESLPIRIRYDRMEMFKDIPSISYDDGADITINDPQSGKYNIDYYSISDSSGFNETWVHHLVEKIDLEMTGTPGEIIVIGADKELLPYSMKDRLAYLQDKINKEKNVEKP